jgi:hypothetical protein
MEPDRDLLERLAEAVHEAFRDHLRAEGYRPGPETRKDKRSHSSLRPYRKLPDDEKEQNRNNARDIANKLASIGYAIVPARGNVTVGELDKDEVKLLGKVEHERWMQQKLDNGWEYARKTNKTKRQHKLLVSWEDLPPEEREKDCILVRGIPQILAKAGYTMIKLSSR